jgi:hypothetical protein
VRSRSDLEVHAVFSAAAATRDAEAGGDPMWRERSAPLRR